MMDGEQFTFNDICARRHKGNKESKDANPSAKSKRKSYNEILHWLAESIDGHTSKEIASLLNKPLNAISGRLSELRASGEIVPTGERRDGAAVLRIK